MNTLKNIALKHKLSMLPTKSLLFTPKKNFYFAKHSHGAGEVSRFKKIIILYTNAKIIYYKLFFLCIFLI